MTKNLSDAEAITQYEKNLQKDSIAKIISQDRHLLGRAVKMVKPEYGHLSDGEVGNMLQKIQTEVSNQTGTLEDLFYSRKYFDKVFYLEPPDSTGKPCIFMFYLEANFYSMTIDQYNTRALEYLCNIFLISRAQLNEIESESEKYKNGVDVYGIWIASNPLLKGKSIHANVNYVLPECIKEFAFLSNMSYSMYFVDDNYQDIDLETEQGSSFFSTIFTTRITGNDKIKLLEQNYGFTFEENAKEKIMSDGFKEYYGEIALQQIEELKNRLSEKEEENSKQKQQLEESSMKLKENSMKLEESSKKLEEKTRLLKEKDIALLKLLMKAEKMNFDEAFDMLK
ncbi:MAG: hypothetical protein ACI4WM_02800, partial [Erysipelotrichaceae bacterium]